jgi:signal transduction histidine kinase
MLRKYLEIPPDSPTPIPPRQFGWYINFWHVVYMGILALMLGAAFWNGRAVLGWREVALTVLVLAQVALYFKILIFNDHWPISGRHFAIYFGGSLLLWFFEWQLAPHFFWLVMSYLGQMYGLLPPIAAIPATSLIFTLVFGESFKWNFSRLDFGDWFGIFMSYATSNVVFIFIYFISRTSSERGNLIVELKAAQQELEAARQRDAELAALRERERLARDLHDSLGHALVALSIQLEAIQRLYKVDPERASAQIDELKHLTRSSMDALRRSLDGLRASGLGDRPLRQALQNLSVEASQRTGAEVTCKIGEGADELNMTLAETIWRVTQEALTNVEKHAQARRVQVTLDPGPQAVTLKVADDGVGLPPDATTRPGHYGLRGIRERVEGLGGALTLNGNNGGGTVIEARLPII